MRTYNSSGVDLSAGVDAVVTTALGAGLADLARLPRRADVDAAREEGRHVFFETGGYGTGDGESRDESKKGGEVDELHSGGWSESDVDRNEIAEMTGLKKVR